MKRVGILAGREVTFPESIINSINERGNGEVVAEMVKVGGIRLDEEKRYDVIIDRISHEVPYYRAMLKRMALEGTYIINNPFWWSADDKFFNFSLAAKLGVAIPKTVLLPQEKYIQDITSESLRKPLVDLKTRRVVGCEALHEYPGEHTAIWNTRSTGKGSLNTSAFPRS